jgi:hypothetical protein
VAIRPEYANLFRARSERKPPPNRTVDALLLRPYGRVYERLLRLFSEPGSMALAWRARRGSMLPVGKRFSVAPQRGSHWFIDSRWLILMAVLLMLGFVLMAFLVSVLFTPSMGSY